MQELMFCTLQLIKLETIEPTMKKIKLENISTGPVLQKVMDKKGKKATKNAPIPFCCYPCTVPLSKECGKCTNCKDKKKNGGLDKIRQKCVDRICEKIKHK